MPNPTDPRARTAPPPPGVAAALAQAGAALCPACGLCCNGVLFGSVRGAESENHEALRAGHLEPQPRAGGWEFPQPCRAHRGRDCAIYPDRPRQCRDFHCRLLQRVAGGDTDGDAALRTIQDTRRMAARVEAWLSDLGDTETSLPLSRRFQRCVAAPAEESSERLETRAELLLAVQALIARLRDAFYTDPEPPAGQ